MDEAYANLGVCFFSDRLYYSVSAPNNSGHLSRIGAYNFNFDVMDAISSRHPEHFPHITAAFQNLHNEFEITSVRGLTNPANECWTVLPKVVYDNADEREDHLAILMKGVNREDIEPIWHTTSKSQQKFLCLRRRGFMNGFEELTQTVATNEFASDFEIAQKWSGFAKPGGSFLMIGCHKNVVSITSFLLGKFRAATYISFDQPEDLPYHWLQNASHLNWMKGLYEHIYMFGFHTHHIEQVLRGFWDESAQITTLNSLQSIGVTADEETYGFDLAEAFPAILLSLDFYPL